MSRHNRERRRARQGKLPKYAPDVLTAVGGANLLPGRAYVIDVRHDDGCALLAGRGPCDCNPEVGRPELVPAPEDN